MACVDSVFRCLVPALTGLLLLLSVAAVGFAQDDFSDPISCYYCFGLAENSSCADPVEKSNLLPINCENGICLKWTHYWNNQLYMHRTCSAKLTNFKIMMIDGVCRSERTGNGYLCMCGTYLCNHGNNPHVTTSAAIVTFSTACMAIFLSSWSWSLWR